MAASRWENQSKENKISNFYNPCRNKIYKTPESVTNNRLCKD